MIRPGNVAQLSLSLGIPVVIEDMIEIETCDSRLWILTLSLNLCSPCRRSLNSTSTY